jgi:hypothetical protein
MAETEGFEPAKVKQEDLRIEQAVARYCGTNTGIGRKHSIIEL